MLSDKKNYGGSEKGSSQRPGLVFYETFRLIMYKTLLSNQLIQSKK